MNLTGRPPYQKTGNGRKGTKQPTTEQKALWARLVARGCVICAQKANIHHCGTGAGGRKDHDNVLPLCVFHHTGALGIHTIGRKKWQEKFGTEQYLREKLLREMGVSASNEE